MPITLNKDSLSEKQYHPCKENTMKNWTYIRCCLFFFRATKYVSVLSLVHLWVGVTHSNFPSFLSAKEDAVNFLFTTMLPESSRCQ